MQQTTPGTVPEPDDISAPFFDDAAPGRLMLQHCSTCGRWCCPVRERCPHCLAAGLAWRPASGRVTLYTIAIMHQVMHPGVAAEAPYNACQVDLEEGVRMVANVVGLPNGASRIGMDLQAVFESAGDGVRIPRFRRAGGQPSGFYMWSFTPMSDAIVQAGGQGDARQVPNNDFILVSGNGGILNFQSTLVFSPHAGGG